MDCVPLAAPPPPQGYPCTALPVSCKSRPHYIQCAAGGIHPGFHQILTKSSCSPAPNHCCDHALHTTVLWSQPSAGHLRLPLWVRKQIPVSRFSVKSFILSTLEPWSHGWRGLKEEAKYMVLSLYPPSSTEEWELRMGEGGAHGNSPALVPQPPPSRFLSWLTRYFHRDLEYGDSILSSHSCPARGRGMHK